jgi:hypothetical protein
MLHIYGVYRKVLGERGINRKEHRDLKSTRLEHGLLVNFGSYKFEIRKFAWNENQQQKI